MRIIDADSHMIEPPLLWMERLDGQFRDRAPRTVKDPDGKRVLFSCVKTRRHCEWRLYMPPGTIWIAVSSTLVSIAARPADGTPEHA
jgi:hypothetical protein